MAKARGNKLVPPANFSRNPMQMAAPRSGTRPQNWIGDGKSTGLQNPVFNGVGFVEAKAPSDPLAGIRPKTAANNPFEEWNRQEREMFTNPPKLTYQQQWRVDHGQNPYNANYIEGVDDLDENGHPVEDNGLQYLANGGPTSFNPRNQDVLARAAAALNDVQQDRQNPMFGQGAGPLPQSIASQPNRFIGPSTPQQPRTPVPINNSVPQIDIWNNGRQIASPEPGVRDRSQRELEATYDLRDKIDALRDRSALRDNPMAPNSPMQPVDPRVAAMQQSIDRGTRQGNIMFEPGAGSSLGATRNFRKIPTEDINGVTAGTVNGYNGNTEYARNPMRLDPETKFNLAEGNARRIAGGGAAADPTNVGGRFGGAYGINLNADATAIQEGRAVRTADGNVVYHTGTPESAREAYMSARANGYGRTPEEEAERHEKAKLQAAARAAKHDAFKAANGGMNYRQYDRMQNSNALTMKAVDEGRLSPEAAMHRMQTRADKALRRAGNPMAMGVANGGRLFPDLLAKRDGRTATPNQNPMTTFGMGTSNTPAGKVAAAGEVSNMAATDPNIVALGVDPSTGVSGLHSALSQHLEDDPNLTLDDSSLRSYQMFAQKALTADPDQSNPSNFTSFPGSVFAETEGAVTSDLWKELASLPDSERARQQWLQKYKDRKKEIEKRQTEYYGSYGS